jgi:hypothetical protein
MLGSGRSCQAPPASGSGCAVAALAPFVLDLEAALVRLQVGPRRRDLFFAEQGHRALVRHGHREVQAVEVEDSQPLLSATANRGGLRSASFICRIISSASIRPSLMSRAICSFVLLLAMRPSRRGDRSSRHHCTPDNTAFRISCDFLPRAGAVGSARPLGMRSVALARQLPRILVAHGLMPGDDRRRASCDGRRSCCAAPLEANRCRHRCGGRRHC